MPAADSRFPVSSAQSVSLVVMNTPVLRARFCLPRGVFHDSSSYWPGSVAVRHVISPGTNGNAVVSQRTGKSRATEKEYRMCFNAGASITAGVLLTVVGTETLRKVHKPEQIAFASIPVVFAFQQFSEGAIWLTHGKPGLESILAVATTVFLIMARSYGRSWSR